MKKTSYYPFRYHFDIHLLSYTEGPASTPTIYSYLLAHQALRFLSFSLGINAILTLGGLCLRLVVDQTSIGSGYSHRMTFMNPVLCTRSQNVSYSDCGAIVIFQKSKRSCQLYICRSCRTPIWCVHVVSSTLSSYSLGAAPLLARLVIMWLSYFSAVTLLLLFCCSHVAAKAVFTHFMVCSSRQRWKIAPSMRKYEI